MKWGLELPNLSTSDIKQFKIDPRKWGIKKQIALTKQKKNQFNKTLDKWLQSDHTHKADKKLTIKLGDK